jgi:hypothetical protein
MRPRWLLIKPLVFSHTIDETINKGSIPAQGRYKFPGFQKADLL